MALAKDSHTELNAIQVSLLRLFSRPMSDDETVELKKLLLDHYTGQLDEEVNRVVTEKGYTQQDFDDMLNSQS